MEYLKVNNINIYVYIIHMYHIPKPPTPPHNKEAAVIIVGLGLFYLITRNRWR